MLLNDRLLIGQSEKEKCVIVPSMANRHGLIAGATGTGKTVTMKVMAESFSDMGVPVFLSDVKGDLSGTCLPGENSEKTESRIARLSIEDVFSYRGFPTRFLDIFGENGHPVRVTVSEIGPTLLSRLFGLTDIQGSVLNIVFRVADDRGLSLVDLKDLREMVRFVGDNRAEFTTEYGNISATSVGAIQRTLLSFEEEGGAKIFGRPEFDIYDLIKTDYNGRGFINILNSSKLIQSPTVYATFLLWLINALFEKLPEVGDLDKPRLVFFFEEAHLLFEDMPKALLGKIVQVVKLIRSKGVGIYFVTQSPSDIPNSVLAQLSNRIQHCLHSYTPSEQTAVRAAAGAFRVNPEFDTYTVLSELGTGEALISFLDENGVPCITQKATILPPQSKIGCADAETVGRVILSSELELKYRNGFDEESAYEIITAAREKLASASAKAEAKGNGKASGKQSKASKTAEKAVTAATSSAARSVSTNIVNSLTGGKTASGGKIAKRSASAALSSVIRSGTNAIIRGLFETKK